MSRDEDILTWVIGQEQDDDEGSRPHVDDIPPGFDDEPFGPPDNPTARDTKNSRTHVAGPFEPPGELLEAGHQPASTPPMVGSEYPCCSCCKQRVTPCRLPHYFRCPTHQWRMKKDPPMSLHTPMAASNVAAVKAQPRAQESHKEVAVSDTTITEPEAVETRVFTEDPTAEPDAVEVPADAVAGDDEPKARAAKTDLEPDVKTVTDAFVTGALVLEDGKFLTPHLIAKHVGENRGSDKAPSTGAVSSVLTRWVEYGFATANEKPFAFLDYTDAGREQGLSAMKQAHRDARKAAKAGDASA
jgi:hypothetical protein